VVLVKARSIPKTSSGKIQRRACKQALAAGELEIVAHSGPEARPAEAQARGCPFAAAFRASQETSPAEPRPASAQAARVRAFLTAQLVELTGQPTLEALDSLAAMDLLGQVERRFGVTIPGAEIVDTSLDRLVDYVVANLPAAPAQSPVPDDGIAALQPIVTRRPFFCVPGTLATSLTFVPLARALGTGQPFYAFDPPGLVDGEAPLRRIEDLARRYVQKIRRVQPSGPYSVGGHSFGGLVAYEIARQLHAAGEEIARVVLLDTSISESTGAAGPVDDADLILELRALLGETGRIDRLFDSHRANAEAVAAYRPAASTLPITLLVAREPMPIERWRPAHARPKLGWEGVAENLTVARVPGDHFSMLRAPHVERIAAMLGPVLAGDVEPEPDAFDPYAMFDAAVDPYPIYARLRQRQPVYFSKRLGAWILTRYADVHAGLRDRRLASDSRNGDDGVTPARGGKLLGVLRGAERRRDTAIAAMMNNFVMFLDPPRHTRLRKLFVKAFTPRVIEGLRDEVRRFVDSAIGRIQARGGGDLMAELALPLPITMILRILGLPTDDMAKLHRWTLDFAGASGLLAPREAVERGHRAVTQFFAYVREQIAHRGPSGGGLLDAMLEAKDGDDPITMEEILAGCCGLFVAGFETTTNMFGNAFVALCRNPEQRALLRAQPELIDNAIDELLRYDGTVQWNLRTAVEDLTIGDATIRRGDTVLLGSAAANRDPLMFPDPDRLDLRRKAAQQVAFGHGRHACLGASLAILELSEVILALVQASPAIHVDESRLRWRNGFLGLRGPECLPVLCGDAARTERRAA
jgi:cytochrome P450/thioesterase domain-containing protein